MATNDISPRTLSVDVLKRGLSQEEFDKLIGLYKKNRKVNRVGKRNQTWSIPLTPDENQFLYDMMWTRDSIIELGVKNNLKLKRNSYYSKLTNIALRYLYQHREELL